MFTLPRALFAMYRVRQDKLVFAAVTSNPQWLIINATCSHDMSTAGGLQVFSMLFPSRTRVDGGTSTWNIVSLIAEGKEGMENHKLGLKHSQR